MIFGAVVDDKRPDEVRVTVIATGFGTPRRRRQQRATSLLGETAPATAPARRRERDPFESPAGEEIDIPSFLRDDS